MAKKDYVVASIPTVASAVKVHGEGGLRLTLDVPEDQEADVLALLPKLRGVAFGLVFLDLTSGEEVAP